MSSLSRRLLVAAALVCLALLPAASQGAAVTIKAVDGSNGWAFAPKKKTVVKGTVVKWKSTSDAIHEVYFYKKPPRTRVSGFTLMPEDVKKRTLKKVGVYKYRCSVQGHSTLSEDGKTCIGMCGKVRVTSS